MKRPLLYMGMTAFFSALIALYLGITAGLAVGGLLFCLGALLLLLYRGEHRSFFLLLLFTASLTVFRTEWEVSRTAQVVSLEGCTAEIAGQVTDSRPVSSGLRRRCKIAVTSVQDRPQAFLMELLVKEGDFVPEIGDDIRAEVFFFPAKSVQERFSQYSKGVSLTGTVRVLKEAAPSAHPLLSARFSLLRKRLSSKILHYLPLEQGDLVAALVLGERERIASGVKNSFQSAGISHILALSGLHVAIVLSLLQRGFAVLKLPNWLRLVLGNAGILFFLAITGASLTARRAGVMGMVLLLADFLSRGDRVYDSLSALGLAVLLLIGENPFSAASFSLWLSLFALLTMSGFIPYLVKKFGELFEKSRRKDAHFYRLLSVVLGLLLPPCAMVFLLAGIEGTFSLASPLTNLLLSPFLPILIAGGLLLAVIPSFPFFIPVLNGVAAMVSLSASFLLKLCRIVEKIPWIIIPLGDGYVTLWLAGMLLMGIYLMRHLEKKSLAVYLLLGVITLECGVFSHQIFSQGVTELSLPPDTFSFVLRRNGQTILLGQPKSSAEGRALASYLRFQGVHRIDVAFFPEGLGSGGAALAEAIPIDYLAVAEERVDRQAANRCKEILSLPAGTKKTEIRLSDSLSFLVKDREDYWEIWALLDEKKLLTLWPDTGVKTMEAQLPEKPHIFLLPQIRVTNIREIPADLLLAGAQTAPLNQAESFRLGTLLAEKGTLRLLVKGDSVRVVGELFSLFRNHLDGTI